MMMKPPQEVARPAAAVPVQLVPAAADHSAPASGVLVAVDVVVAALDPAPADLQKVVPALEMLLLLLLLLEHLLVVAALFLRTQREQATPLGSAVLGSPSSSWCAC
nr:unnamed protein product [Digitaria exilis]